MANLFGKLTTDGLQESVDRLGGFQPLDSDIYFGTVKAFYAGQSTGGATSLTLIADINGKEYKEILYVTNKQGENFFKNKDGKKVPLPGFTVADDICLVTTGEPLAAQETEEKVVNVYDPEQKKEMPKSVQMVMGVVGQPIALGIIKQIVNKNEKQGDEYVPTAETREENYIDKVFHAERKITVVEARNQQDEPKFYDAWLKRNKGEVRDKTTVKDGQGGTTAAPKAGQKPAPAAGQPARKSLFSK